MTQKIEQMTRRQFQNWLRKYANLTIEHMESAGGGNRDHAYWYVHWSDGTMTHVQDCGASGSMDGKNYCESCARRIAWQEKAVEYNVILTDC